MADRVRDRRGVCGAAAIAGRTGASAAARNRGAQSGLRRLHPRRCRRRTGHCTQGGDGHCRRPVAGAIARHPARRERQYRYRRRSRRPAIPKSCSTTLHRATPRPSPTCAPLAQSCWASSRCTNSRSAARPRSCRSRLRAIRGIPTITPADRRRAPAWRSPPALCRCRSAPTPAARSATRRAIAAWSDLNPPTTWCRAAASFRSPSRSTMSGRWRARSPTWRYSWTGLSDPIRRIRFAPPIPRARRARFADRLRPAMA